MRPYALTAGHGDPRASRVLRPRSRPGRGPLLPLFLPLLSVHRTVGRSPEPNASASSMPPAMTTDVSALPSGRRIGLGGFPFTPAVSRCPRFFEPWPVGLVPRAPVTTSPSAMEPCRRSYCSGRRLPFSLFPSLIQAVSCLIDGPEWPIPFRPGSFA